MSGIGGARAMGCSNWKRLKRAVGNMVEDLRVIEVPRYASEGDCRLEIGLYSMEPAERLRIEGAREGDLADRALTVPIGIHR